MDVLGSVSHSRPLAWALVLDAIVHDEPYLIEGLNHRRVHHAWNARCAAVRIAHVDFAGLDFPRTCFRIAVEWAAVLMVEKGYASYWRQSGKFNCGEH
jgi:hypothetical protein